MENIVSVLDAVLWDEDDLISRGNGCLSAQLGRHSSWLSALPPCLPVLSYFLEAA